MKKKVFSLMMTLLLAFMGVAKADVVEIGDGTGTTYYFPIDNFFNYSCTEQIYLASEIGTAGTINAISFYYNYGTAYTANNVTMYMKNVSRSEFASTSDYEPLSAADIVWTGAIAPTAAGWYTFTLDTPFEYNGTDNLLVAFFDGTSGYPGTSYTWRQTTSPESAYMALRYYSDSSSPDPYNLGSYSGSKTWYTYRGNVQIDITPGGGGASVPYEAQIGEGTSTTSYFPFYTLYNYSIAENLFLASELTEAGVMPGQVTSLSWYATNETGYAQQGISIWMANVSDTELTTTSHVTTDMTLVYTGSMTPATGWNEFPCNAGTFTWDGTSNVLILCQRNNGDWNSTVNWQAGNVGFTAMSYSYQDSGAYDVTVSNTMYTSSNRANIIIKGVGAGAGSVVTEIIDFEDGQLPEGWTTEGYNDWYVDTEDYWGHAPAYEGDYSLYVDGNGAYDYDYLYSPAYTFNGTGSISFAFSTPAWSGDQNSLSVGYSSDRAVADPWTWLTVGATNDGWTTATFDLPLTGNYYFCFRSYDGYGYCTALDYISITHAGEGGPDYEVVDAIEIEGFEMPQWGVTPTDNTYVPEDANYELVESYWSYYYPDRGETRGQARLIVPDPNFTEMDGRAYYMHFDITANEGYGFTNNTVAYLNGDASMFSEEWSTIEEYYAELETIDFFPEDAYEAGLHTYALYGVGENQYENIDRLLIERPNGAWMEPYHFQLYNDGEEDVEVVLIDFLHNNGYFSMDSLTTEYPFTVEATGLPGVDLYINTNIDWESTEVINSLLAVNTTERSTHLYPIIAAPYQPYCPDVYEHAYPITNITAGETWSMWTSEMWEEINPEPEYELHDNYTLPFPNIPEGYDAVMTFTLDHDMILNASVTDALCDNGRDDFNGKVALYRADFNGEGGPMADNYYDGRPMSNVPTGGNQPAYQAQVGNGTTLSGYLPMYYLYNYSLSTQLFGADELAAAGANTAPMNSISWYSESTYNHTINNVSIWMANVSDNAVATSSPLGSNMTLVYQGNFQEVVGWNEFVFNQGTFSWDGHSNVLVMTQMNNGSWSSSIQWFNHNPGFQAAGYVYQDNNPYNAGTQSYTLTTSSTNRANTMFKSNGGRFTIGGQQFVNDPTSETSTHFATAQVNRAPWDLLNTIECSSGYQYGVATDGQYIYTSAWSSGAGFMFAKYDMEGNFIETFNIAGCGYIRDMTYDGQYFYGGANGSALYCFDLANQTLISTINTGVSVIRSCAYDPVNDGFWVGTGWGGDGYIYRINRAGTVVFNGPYSYNCSGLAYYEDEDGVHHLYINHQDNSHVVYDYNIDSNTLNSTAIYDYSTMPNAGSNSAGGCFIAEYDGKVAFFGDIQGSPNHIGIFELKDATTEPEDPEEPEEAVYTAGPVIEGLNVLAGTYYLVASSTCEDFEVTINFEELPCPIEAVTNIYPEDNAYDIPSNDLTLRWTLNDYANEWRIVFGSTYYPEDEPEHPATYISEWSSDLQESLRITDYVHLWNNTNYFWRIEQRSNPGTEWECVTSGPVFGFTTSLNVPQNLQVNGAGDAYIFETEQDVTLTWNAIQDRTYRRYRIYWNDSLYYETPFNEVVTSYTIPNSEFHYNMVPHVPEQFNVTAVYDEGESPMSNPVFVHVSGYGTISGTVYEQDETTPIGGVTVFIQGTNEFGNPESYTFTTNAEGYYEGEVHVGHYHSAIASMEGYQTASTIHPLPFDIIYQEETDHVDFILDETFYAPAHVCAQTMYVEGVEGDSLVQVWWDFNFYTALIEDFEDFDNTNFEWTNSGSYPWTITTNDPYEGSYCLKSGGAGVANVVSDLSVTVEVPNDGIMSFFAKPSCENNWDFGYFYIDGVQMAQFTGAGNWGEKQFAITEGAHTFKWSYQKDGSVNSNDDCIYIDYIQFNRLPEPPVVGNSYDFENGMQGWTNIDADGDGNVWMLGSELMSGVSGHNGSNDFVFSQSYSNTYGVLYPDNYLVSPQVQLGGIVKFYACAQDASYAAEHFGLAVSTTNGTNASAFTTVQQWTMSAKSGGEAKPIHLNTRSGRAQGNWYEYTVDLSAYAGQTGYVAIRHFNCSDMFYLDVDDITIGDASKGDKAVAENRSLHHFNIYRTDCYNDGPYNSENTTFLSTVWRPDTSYFDVQWPQVPVGVYKWGVSAVYQGNQADNPNNPRIDYPFEERESEITWHTMCSPCIDKDMYIDGGVSVNVVLNSADSPEGVQVSFTNLNPGEEFNHPQEGVTLDQTGYYVFPRFRKGDYLVTVSMPGYYTLEVEESIWEPTALRYVLTEIICTVQNLYVSRTGWAMWDPQAPCPGGATPVNPDDPTPEPGEGQSYDFENGIPAGWTTIDADGDGFNWMLASDLMGSGYGHDGSEDCVVSQSYSNTYGALTPDNYFVSPQVQLGGSISFWACAQDNAWAAEHFGVAVSTTNNTNASAFTTIQQWTMTAKGGNGKVAPGRDGQNRTQGTWYQYTVDLSAYSGMGYVAIRHFNCTDYFYLDVDDITITAPGRAVTAERHLEGFKVMCTSIDGEPIFNHNTPADQPFCQLATDELVEGNHYIVKVAAIYSTGMSEYEQVEWQYEPCDHYVGTVNGPTIEGNTISWDYPGSGVGPTPPPTGASTFTQGFEDGLGEWTVIDGNNDGNTWCLTSAIPSTWTYYSGMTLDWYHNGSNAVCSGSYINGVGALNPNEYLVSPQVTLAAGSQLSFWVAACDAGYPADHFGVFISDNGTSDWTSVQEWTLTAKSEGKAGSPASRDGRGLRLGTWYNYTVDLSAYAGQKYIAFRHFNCYDQYIMCLDDVELTAGAKGGVVYTEDDYIRMNSIAPVNTGDVNPLPVVTGNGRGNDAYACNAYGGTNPTGWITYDVDAPGAGTSLNSGLTVYGGSIAADGYVYATYNDNTWKKIEPLTGNVVASGNLGMFFVDCTYDYTTDVMYGSYSGTLYTWDLATNTTATVGAMHGSMQMIACDLNGQMYGIEYNTGDFFAIDKATGACTLIGNTGQSPAYVQSGGFDHNTGKLYWAGYTSTGIFAEVNVATGALTMLGNNVGEHLSWCVPYEYNPTPEPPVSAEGILGAMIFVDGEWEAFVEYPTNSYTYEGEGEEICVRMVYDGDAELIENNYYYAMSCEECLPFVEPEPTCEAAAPIYAVVNDADDQVHIYWDEQPEPPEPEEGDTFEYDFEDGSIDGLVLIDNDGDGYNWLVNTTFGGHNASTGIIYSQSYDNNYGALTPDNYIVFPQSNIVAGSTFSFWACGQDSGWASEHFGVAVSTSGTNAADFTTVQEWTMTAKGTKAVRDGRAQGNWYHYTVDLSDYAGMPVYIALRHFNCTDMFYLDVDDVELSVASKGNRDSEIIGYNIYRSTDNIDYVLIATVDGDVTEYFDAPGEGTYYYQVTTLYEGCESAPAVSGENPDVNYVMVGVTGVGESSDNVALFPNPTKGNVTIQAMNMNRITVVSVLGQVVYDTELDQDEYILNMSQFNTGMYMVRVYTDEGVTVKRVTVLH